MTPATSRKACLCLCCITLLARAGEPPAAKPPAPPTLPAQPANPRETWKKKRPDCQRSANPHRPRHHRRGWSRPDVQQAKTRLLQTQNKMLRWEKLLKDGVLSRSEVERCTVELAEALARYEHANLDELRRQLASVHERVAAGSADQALVEAGMPRSIRPKPRPLGPTPSFFQTKIRSRQN